MYCNMGCDDDENSANNNNANNNNNHGGAARIQTHFRWERDITRQRRVKRQGILASGVWICIEVCLRLVTVLLFPTFVTLSLSPSLSPSLSLSLSLSSMGTHAHALIWPTRLTGNKSQWLTRSHYLSLAGLCVPESLCVCAFACSSWKHTTVVCVFVTFLHRSTESTYSDQTIVEVQMLSGFEPYDKDLDRVSTHQQLEGKDAQCHESDLTQCIQTAQRQSFPKQNQTKPVTITPEYLYQTECYSM